MVKYHDLLNVTGKPSGKSGNTERHFVREGIRKNRADRLRIRP